ncbi:MAG: hypothetical protein ACE5EY_00805 [Anaerolineae bacterium]
MEKLKAQIKTLPTTTVGDKTYLSYQAVTDTVAAFLFPAQPPDQIDAAGYQRILETADNLCRELGYPSIEKLTPPDVAFSDMGLYFGSASTDCQAEDVDVIMAGPGRVEMMQDGLLLDARLSQLGLDEVTRQHFKIPVTASDGVIDLMHRAVASDWPNDYKGIWHDLMGMCIAGGKDISPDERLFTVIIRGVGRRRYWRFKAQLQQDNSGSPFLNICLADERDQNVLFELGHVVMTPGAAALGVDFTPFIVRHAAGDDGELEPFDKQQNRRAIKEGLRILSAYDVPTGDGETERIWIITEADRSVTTILKPEDY